MQAQARPRLDLQRLYRDAEKYAALVEVPFQGDIVQKFLAAYQELYAASAVAFRTTTRPKEKREVSLRYINHGYEHDPYQIALDHGFIAETGHPIEKLLKDTMERIPLLGMGVDIGVSHGMEKIWPLFSVAVPMEKIYEIPSIPRCMADYDAYFKKYDLTHCTLFAIDYWHKSVNVYFPVKEMGRYSTTDITGMITDLGLQVPSQEELEINARSGIIYHTFTWDSPRCERLSFGVPHVPVHQFPTHLHPVFDRLFKEAPVLADETKGAFMTAYLPNHHDYLKIEIDYTGTMFFALGASIFVPPMN